MTNPSRRLPDVSELWEFLRPRLGRHQGRHRRLQRAQDVRELRELARRSTPRGVFDYADGAAEQEITAGRARALFDAVEFSPSALVDVSTISLAVDVLGVPSALPFAFAPTGFTRMMHSDGERAVARTASRHGLIMGLSTMATTSIEEVAAEAPGARRWFQLYPSRDRELDHQLVRRARLHGYEALVITVDVPTPGPRFRDVRNGFTFPPQLPLQTYVDGMCHPRWTWNFLTTSPPSFASLGGTLRDIGPHMGRLFDPSAQLSDIERLRDEWNGPILIKGVQSVRDAERFASIGVEGIILSNHGGRQLDRSPQPLELLPEVRAAVGDRLTIGVDSGIRTGGDIIACLAHGADFTLIGRAFLYGLMAGGEAGVERVVELVQTELTRTLRMLGVAAVTELRPEHVRLPVRTTRS